MMPMARVERCHGSTPTSQPMAGPPTIDTAVMSEINRPAAWSLRPSPMTKNGRPHSNARVLPLNGVVKCTQNASRVPGWRQETARSPTTCANGRLARWTDRAAGVSRSSASARRNTATPASEETR